MHKAKFDGAEYNLAARLSSRRCCSLANEVRAWLIGDLARRVLLVYVAIICSCVLRRRLVINISRPESINLMKTEQERDFQRVSNLFTLSYIQSERPQKSRCVTREQRTRSPHFCTLSIYNCLVVPRWENMRQKSTWIIISPWEKGEIIKFQVMRGSLQRAKKEVARLHPLCKFPTNRERFQKQRDCFY